jgi:hypothetical protein
VVGRVAMAFGSVISSSAVAGTPPKSVNVSRSTRNLSAGRLPTPAVSY